MKKIEWVSIICVGIVALVLIGGKFVPNGNSWNYVAVLNPVLFLALSVQLVSFIVTVIYLCIKNQEHIKRKLITLLFCLIATVAIWAMRNVLNNYQQPAPVPDGSTCDLSIGVCPI